MLIGCIYYWGQGAAVDYPRAFAAYKVGANGGNAHAQVQLGTMLSWGDCDGVEVDVEEGAAWLERARAQDNTAACVMLGRLRMASAGKTSSWRRARECFQQGIELGSAEAVMDMEELRGCIQKVPRSHAGNYSGL